MLGPALLLLSAAHADVAPEPPSGEQFTTYSVRVEGLAAFPDVVLVVHDKSGGELRGYATLTADKSEAQLGNGRSWRENNIPSPDLFVMPRAAYEAWAQATAAEVARQEEACSERGEGCAHISRFVPHFAAPTGTTPCRATIDITTTAKAGGPDAYVDVFQLKAAAPGTCTVEGPARIALRGGKPVSASGRCAAVTPGGGLAVLLAALGITGLRRRRR